MSGLSVDIALDLPGFRLAVSQHFAPTGLTAVFGPSASGK
jgi:molybdate transport system ATP-binding protein